MADPNVLVFTQQLVMVDGFVLDCSLSESHEFESDITDDPVESGSNTTDNIQPKPNVITMEFLVSNTPLGQLASGGAHARDPVSEPADDAYEHFMKIRNAREPVVIRTSLRTYERMGLKNLSVPRASGRGDEFRATATFKEMIIVDNKRSTRTRVAIPGAYGGKAISKPLVPAPQTGAQSSQTMFTITKSSKPGDNNAFGEGSWIWFDTTINAWRFGVIEPDPERVGVGGLLANSPILTLGVGEGESTAPQLVRSLQWRFFRGRIVGYTFSQWQGRDRTKTPEQYRDSITAANKALGDHSPYNPGFKTETDSNLHTTDTLTYGHPVQVVKGILVQ